MVKNKEVPKGARMGKATAGMQLTHSWRIDMRLPIENVKGLFIETVNNNQVTILVGETGSGKTTRLPLFLYEAGFARSGVIGITEPRRIAAVSTANYVAGELNVPLGTKVGYQIRFDRMDERNTDIRFMTDGILLREIQSDPELSRYSVIMVDEAHERSINIDFLLGLLKELLKRRPDLKVVISSATIDAEKFSEYFNGAPIISVPGRVYPVEIIWHADDQCIWDTQHMVRLVTETVLNIHSTCKEGDILVFLAGTDEISAVGRAIEEKITPDIVILPAHGGMANEDQSRIFKDFDGKRKVILATNIAETGITIPNLRYVVDTGRIKEVSFHPYSGIQSLNLTQHSQAGCNQRTGRAGRTTSGMCFRLYTEQNFSQRPEYTEPEIRKMDLSTVVLAMEDMNIPNIPNFDFIDKPDKAAFQHAYRELVKLGAINEQTELLTKLGLKMARLPLAPMISKMIFEAQTNGCVAQIATVAAFFSAQPVFRRPKGKENDADLAHNQFRDRKSDALTFLRVWDEFQSLGFSQDWCYNNFLDYRTMNEVRQIRSQLFRILRDEGIELSTSQDMDMVRLSFSAGLVSMLFVQSGKYSFRSWFNGMTDVFIHPGSVLFGSLVPQLLVAAEVVETKKCYARVCSRVEAEWLPIIAPDKFRFQPWQVISYEPGAEIATVQRHIIDVCSGSGLKLNKLGNQLKDVSLAKAAEIQEASIKEAERLGWKRATLRATNSSFGRYYINEPALTEVERYADIPLADGSVYYFTFKDSFFGDNRIAVAQFRVFDFPKEEKKPESVADAIGKLTQAWANR